MITIQEITICDANGNSLHDLVQWDKDVVIYAMHDEIDKAYDVHFFNSNMNKALVVHSTYKNNTLAAKIPNDLLKQHFPVLGYIFVVKDNEQKSILGFKIMVRRRPQPSDYVYVDSKDYVFWEEILEECKTLCGSTIIEEFTIPCNNWKIVDNERTKYNRYYTDVEITGLLSDYYPEITIHIDSYKIVEDAKLCPTALTLDGTVRFWAKNIPNDDIHATGKFSTEKGDAVSSRDSSSSGGSSGGSGGSNNYKLPIATSTRLGGVKIGEGIDVTSDGTISSHTKLSNENIVTDEETIDMIRKVFS